MTPGTGNGEFQEITIPPNFTQYPPAREMFRYAQDMSSCRKVFFAKCVLTFWGIEHTEAENTTSRYFSGSVGVEVSDWSADGTAALEPCGHCDNCLRDPTSHKHEDKTLEAWQILKIAEEVHRLRGNVTIASLAALACGRRQSKVKVKQRRGGATEVQIDVNTVAGGKVNLSVSVCSLSAPHRPAPFINLFLGVERTQRSSLYSYSSRVI